jgi:hypothetical protein
MAGFVSESFHGAMNRLLLFIPPPYPPESPTQEDSLLVVWHFNRLRGKIRTIIDYRFTHTVWLG